MLPSGISPGCGAPVRSHDRRSVAVARGGDQRVGDRTSVEAVHASDAEPHEAPLH